MNNNWLGISFASTLAPSTLQAIDERGWKIDHRTGDPVIWEGDECSAVYYVLSGAVEIYRTSVDGREHTLGIILPGEGFNLVPVLREKGDNPANARCVKDTELLALGAADAREIMRRYPDAAMAFAEEMAERLRGMANQAGALALHSVRQRLAAFLIAEANKLEHSPHLQWTRDDMARQIGTVRDVIGRNLKRFEEEGMIKRIKGDILLLNGEKLRRIADGDDAT